MTSFGFRNKKSEWLLSGFYFLTFFILLTYASIFLRVAAVGIWNALTKSIAEDFINVVTDSFSATMWSFLLASITSIALTTFLVLCDGHRVGKIAEKILKGLKAIPMLIAGVSIVFWLSLLDMNSLVIIILTFIVFPRLTLSWFTIARRLKPIMIEAALSLGMGFWQVLYYIYLKKYIKHFLKSLVSMFLSVIGLVTPFLYFMSKTSVDSEMIGLSIFRDLREAPSVGSLAPTLVFMLLLMSVANVFLNSVGENYGELNG